ncbi:MAG: hypothetical protein M3R59_01235 [Verrucomicrobiota bacterium]|nr:hypothetical protein [Verrucomicrobiota bacterium]
MTVFVGCGFAAKYREGGGNFSVPLQRMLGLRRIAADAIWLEVFPATDNPGADRGAIRAFQRQLRAHGLAERYCLLYQAKRDQAHDLARCEIFGLSDLRARLGGPNVLLNLSYSIHPPLLLEFERRIFCDIDPSEFFYWMTKMELGQSTHHAYWTIGLNFGARDCLLPDTGLPWKTFLPLVDTELMRAQPRASGGKFTTVGQWYWNGSVEVNGEFPDLSKRVAFEKYLALPQRVPGARFELAMNMREDDPERARLSGLGWQVVDPHRVTSSAKRYRRYLASADAEFTAIKGVDVAWRTGWLSDRAAAFLALGRPVITEDTGAARYLPPSNGFHFVQDLESASDAVRRVQSDWKIESARARATAQECFDGARTLRRILAHDR